MYFVVSKHYTKCMFTLYWANKFYHLNKLIITNYLKMYIMVNIYTCNFNIQNVLQSLQSGIVTKFKYIIRIKIESPQVYVTLSVIYLDLNKNKTS